MIIAKFTLFLSIVSLVYWAMHYYSYAHIKKDFALSSVQTVFLKVFFCIGGISYFAGRMIQSRNGAVFVLEAGEIWMGAISISVTVFAVRDLLSLFVREKAKELTILALAATLVLSSAALINAKRTAIRNLTLDSPGFAPCEEYKIVVLSDLHLADNKSVLWLEDIVAKTNRLNPDLIVLPGDLFEGGLKTKKELFVSSLRKFKSVDGVFAVTGNHECYAGLKKFERFAADSGIKVLRNESAVIDGKIILAGVDDEAGAEEIDKALPPEPAVLPVVLLSHRGDIFKEISSKGIFLQLSGHTHAGQIPFFNIIVKLYFKYPYGLYREGNSYLYTSSGAGTWGPPMRLFSKSEIVCVTIQK